MIIVLYRVRCEIHNLMVTVNDVCVWLCCFIKFYGETENVHMNFMFSTNGLSVYFLRLYDVNQSIDYYYT